LLEADVPGLDGYSVLEGLERDRPGAYRVVFTTVHGGEAEQLRGLEAGALDYLVKPISLRVALEKIRRWVGRCRVASPWVSWQRSQPRCGSLWRSSSFSLHGSRS